MAVSDWPREPPPYTLPRMGFAMTYLPRRAGAVLLMSALAFAVLDGSSAPRAAASSGVEMSLEDLTREADAIAVVEVTRAEGFRRKGKIPVFTRTSLNVVEYWKGEGKASLDVVAPGGRIGDTVILAHGVPAFAEGQTLVLFLFKHRAPFDGYGILGLEQGAFHVIRAKDGRLWAARHGSMELVKKDPLGGPSMTTAATANAMPIESLEAQVRALLAKIASTNGGTTK